MKTPIDILMAVTNQFGIPVVIDSGNRTITIGNRKYSFVCNPLQEAVVDIIAIALFEYSKKSDGSNNTTST